MKPYTPRSAQTPREIIYTILEQYISLSSYTVFLFGSRARGEKKPGSDRDVGIRGQIPLDRSVMHRIQCAFTDCALPVDIVDFSSLDTPFKQQTYQHILHF